MAAEPCYRLYCLFTYTKYSNGHGNQWHRPDRWATGKTRAALHWALLTLLAQKPYREISVDDVTTAADVGRTTFDAQYRDKTELLDEAAREC